MEHKNHYKKIFVIAAALFVLFAPVGMTLGGGASGLTATPTVDLAQAQGTGAAGISGAAATVTSGATSGAPSGGASLTGTPSSPASPAATSPGTNAGTTTGVGAGASSAQNPSLWSCSGSLATCGVYYVALVVNGIMAGALTLFALLVQLALQFNDNIFNSPAVQTGFSVALAIANLGFVLGIIIIAIATIIRNQTYGIKQLLWKLVFMAILVNFGLVITAPIVGFANNMSQYFINATSPSTATGGYQQYVATLTGAFQPQTTLNTPASTGSAGPSICTSTDPKIAAACLVKGNAGTLAITDTFWQQTMALLFDVAFSATAVFVFLCLFVLLLVRYLILGGLLIVLPLAWLTYIFPKFDNSFSKWWNTFIKWVFFPPLALFFIYLAFITATTTNPSQGANGATQYTASAIGGNILTNNVLIQTLATETGLTGGVFEQFADEVLLIGLMIMGLMFALSLSGKAGKVTVGAVGGASKAFGTWAGKTGRRAGYNAATRALRPKAKIDPITGAQYTPLTQMNRLRGAASLWTANQAASPNLKTKGLASSVWNGAKNGSGLFAKKGSAKDWECQNCNSHVERSTKKPTRSCPNCGATATVANWQEV